MILSFPADAVVVVAGVPGAGKSTLIRRAVDRDAVHVLDTDDHRDRGHLVRIAGHYARIAGAVLGVPDPVVIHSRGTRGVLRRAIAALAWARGRPAHLVLLTADREVAEAGQRTRGRLVPARVMDREVRRFVRLLERRGAGEGWRSVRVLDRREAAAVSRLFFAPAPQPAGKTRAAALQ
jgi:predicted kinase